MNTCGTCKYRGKEITVTAYDEAGDVLGRDQATGFFLCGFIKHCGQEHDAYQWAKGTGAAVVDGSGYHAALCVEADFGCNKWEAPK